MDILRSNFILWLLCAAFVNGGVLTHNDGYPQCELIRIEMCKDIGYNETAMPNLVGELQTDVEFTLQTFLPLIEYKCSSQIKLFLCAAYVPMCTVKVPVPIGPCRSLCESVHSRCNPVLQSFGYPWPLALECNHFPKQNNHEHMCIELPIEPNSPLKEESDPYLSQPELTTKAVVQDTFLCKGRCPPRCDIDILFGQNEKHLAEIYICTWTYAALGLALIATLCIILIPESKTGSKWLRLLHPLVYCHNAVAIGWCIRFVAGRTNNACGFENQLPNISKASCAATFLLRYYFGMAACAWWAILCLDWHRNVRQNTNMQTQAKVLATNSRSQKLAETKELKGIHDVTKSNLARFAAWGLPGFQTAAVIVARIVDADELLGACFVGNQSDMGLQILVATPLFCYWIFGTMNLISGYLVHRRNKTIMSATNLSGIQQHTLKQRTNPNSGYATFLVIYCVPSTLLLFAIIYEFLNIDVWLSVPTSVIAKNGFQTPLWPFLTRAFMELMLGIICSAWALGPKISTIHRQKCSSMTKPSNQLAVKAVPSNSSHSSNVAYTSVSYQTIRPQTAYHSQQHVTADVMQPKRHSSNRSSSSIQQGSRYSMKTKPSSHHAKAKRRDNSMQHTFYGPYGNETIL